MTHRIEGGGTPSPEFKPVQFNVTNENGNLVYTHGDVKITVPGKSNSKGVPVNAMGIFTAAKAGNTWKFSGLNGATLENNGNPMWAYFEDSHDNTLIFDGNGQADIIQLTETTSGNIVKGSKIDTLWDDTNFGVNKNRNANNRKHENYTYLQHLSYSDYEDKK